MLFPARSAFLPKRRNGGGGGGEQWQVMRPSQERGQRVNENRMNTNKPLTLVSDATLRSVSLEFAV